MRQRAWTGKLEDIKCNALCGKELTFDHSWLTSCIWRYTWWNRPIGKRCSITFYCPMASVNTMHHKKQTNLASPRGKTISYLVRCLKAIFLNHDRIKSENSYSFVSHSRYKKTYLGYQTGYKVVPLWTEASFRTWHVGLSLKLCSPRTKTSKICSHCHFQNHWNIWSVMTLVMGLLPLLVNWSRNVLFLMFVWLCTSSASVPGGLNTKTITEATKWFHSHSILVEWV